MRTILDRLSDGPIGSARRRDVRGALIGLIEALTFGSRRDIEPMVKG